MSDRNKQGNPRLRRALQIVLSLAVVVVIFVFAFPKIANYSDVWAEVQDMTWIELATVAAAALWNLITYWFVMVASLPGSNVWQAMKVNATSTAVSNSLPGGGAIGIAVTYGMYSQYGIAKSDITLSIVVTGIWNNFVKLGMPVIALALLAVQGDASGSLLLAAVIGVLALAGAILLFALVLRSEELARKVGGWLGRPVSLARRPFKKPPVNMAESVVDFRRTAIGLLKHRWLQLTLAAVVSHFSLYLVLLLSLRHVGVSEDNVSWVQVLAAFSFIRLVSALPITPGGVGVVELGLTAALVAAGGAEAEVAAGVLVYRALTYLLPIPIGAILYLEWRSGSTARKERVAVAKRDAEEAGSGSVEASSPGSVETRS
jgi:putative heme transporter